MIVWILLKAIACWIGLAKVNNSKYQTNGAFGSHLIPDGPVWWWEIIGVLIENGPKPPSCYWLVELLMGGVDYSGLVNVVE